MWVILFIVMINSNFYYEVYDSDYLLEKKETDRILINKRNNKDYSITYLNIINLLFCE